MGIAKFLFVLLLSFVGVFPQVSFAQDKAIEISLVLSQMESVDQLIGLETSLSFFNSDFQGLKINDSNVALSDSWLIRSHDTRAIIAAFVAIRESPGSDKIGSFLVLADPQAQDSINVLNGKAPEYARYFINNMILEMPNLQKSIMKSNGTLLIPSHDFFLLAQLDLYFSGSGFSPQRLTRTEIGSPSFQALYINFESFRDIAFQPFSANDVILMAEEYLESTVKEEITDRPLEKRNFSYEVISAMDSLHMQPTCNSLFGLY